MQAASLRVHSLSERLRGNRANNCERNVFLPGSGQAQSDFQYLPNLQFYTPPVPALRAGVLKRGLS